MESTYKDVVHLQEKTLAEGASSEVNKLKIKPAGKKKYEKPSAAANSQQPKGQGAPKQKLKPCYRCLRTNRTPDKCRFINATCHGCH